MPPLYCGLVKPLVIFWLFFIISTQARRIAPVERADMGTVIGIDLGTTFSCAAVMRFGKIDIIPNFEGKHTTPSWIAFTTEGLLIGEKAKNSLEYDPANTIYDTKRLIGRKLKDMGEFTQHFSYNLNKMKDGSVMIPIQFNGLRHSFTPEEISAQILSNLKEAAESYLDEIISRAVISVPARFNNVQRQATKDAGKISGLHVLGIINEPTAAALAYGFDKKRDDDTYVLVYDLGGGTLDVSLLYIAANGFLDVLYSKGDPSLGGEDFDNRICDYLIDIFKRKTGLDASHDSFALRKLKRAAEDAKQALSNQMTTTIRIFNLTNGVDFSETLTRDLFESLNEDLFNRTMLSVGDIFEDERVRKDEVKEIILVGGSSKIPKIRQIVKSYFGGLEPVQGVNPDEAIAYGAAIHAATLSNKETGLRYLDASSLAIGFENKKGEMVIVIPGGTKLPFITEEKLRYQGRSGNKETVVRIPIFEGERAIAMDNLHLGTVRLTIPPGKRDKDEISVIYRLGRDGIFSISVKDEYTGAKLSHTFNSSANRLSQTEISRMIANAKEFEETDRQIRRQRALGQLAEIHEVSREALARHGSLEQGLGDRATEFYGFSDELERLVAVGGGSESLEDLEARVRSFKAFLHQGEPPESELQHDEL